MPKKSRVNEAGNYTKPTIRKRLFERIKAGSKGGKPGQWSARKSQILASEYKKKGGGYRSGGKTKTQKSLDRWTKQEWGSEKKGGVYLPKKSRAALKSTPEGRRKLRQAERKKRQATKAGKQFSRHGLHKGKKR